MAAPLSESTIAVINPNDEATLKQQLALAASMVCKETVGSGKTALEVSIGPPSSWDPRTTPSEAKVLKLHVNCSVQASAAEPPEIPIFSGVVVLLLCAAWTVFWLLFHCLCHWAPVWMVLIGAAIFWVIDWGRFKPLSRRRGRWRHLARAQVYNVVVVSAGIFLAAEYQSVRDLHRHFTKRHQLAFTCAIGHWLVAFVEHSLCPAGLGILKELHVLHHALAACVFALCLWTQRMSAVGTGGLLFELPVIFENILASLRWCNSLAALKAEHLRVLWDITLDAVVLGRFLPLLIYAYLMLYWQEEWKDVPCVWAWNSAFWIFLAFTVGWYTILTIHRRHDLLGLKEEGNAVVNDTVNSPEEDRETSELLATEIVPTEEEAEVQVPGCHTRETAQKNNSNEINLDSTHGRCLVTLYGKSCDVTDFLHEHPGGAAPLLQHAGTDATVAFETVGHSMAAFERLRLMLAAQPSVDNTTSAVTVDGAASVAATVAAATAVAAVSSAAPPVAGTAPTPKSRSMRESAPALNDIYSPFWQPKGASRRIVLVAKSAAAVWCLLLLRSVPTERTVASTLLGLGLFSIVGTALMMRTCARSLLVGLRDPKANACALALICMVVAMEASSARSLAFGSAGALFVGTFRHAQSTESLKLQNWCLLGVYLLPTVYSSSYLIFLLCSVAIAVTLPFICERFRTNDLTFPAKAIPLAGLWSFLSWFILSRASVGVSGAFQSDALGTRGHIAAICFPAAVAGIVGCAYASLVDLVRGTSPVTTSSWVAFLIGVPVAWAEATSISGLIALWGWWLLVKHQTNMLESRTTSLVEANEQALSIRFIVDAARGSAAMLLWYIITRPAEAFVSWMLPADLRVFAFEAPLRDLAGDLKLGVCLMLEGGQYEPGHVVCNVGHIPRAIFEDVRATVSASLDIMDELRVDTPGFVSNLLCVVPDVNKPRSMFDLEWLSMREINLSVWESHEAAMKWYRESAAHSSILEAHHRGGLKGFGDLLMSLKPISVRWQRRCRTCAGLVEGIGSQQCPRCRGNTYAVPMF
eukprot:TRINITY_DN3339_c1_g1_i1.p1 TRINITY_DN3339_c1_g1~~TRINITY_DN3339_c1_g1_i1.p1  ORF type:complete len:1071 (-),score=125.67 TRINITY_DN3339_c1_g1_i1:124-3234(-)